MSARILLTISPSSPTECGVCPVANGAGCGAFGEIRVGGYVRGVVQYQRLHACIEAERQAQALAKGDV